MGWPEDQIRVIDSDQEISGSSSNDRLGFQEILSLVSMSQVGIIFGYEVSRIARTHAAWFPLVQLADVFGVQDFFEAIQPAQLDALAALLDQSRQDHAKLDQQWQQRLQRTAYEAQRAERQYNQADPKNRLVTASLEKRWEEKLGTLHDTQREYARFQQQRATAGISPQLQQQFQHISETLPTLWPELSYPDHKEWLRTLFSQVTFTPKDKTTLEVKIVWLSGHYSIFAADPPHSEMGRSSLLSPTA